MNLKQERKKRGLSQIDLAQRLGVHINTYINWERGVSKPNNENKAKLYQALNILKPREPHNEKQFCSLP